LGITGRLSISNEVVKHEKFNLKIRNADTIVNLKFSDPRGFGRYFVSEKKPKENFIDPREKGFYSSLKSKIVGKERAIFLLLLDQSIAFGVGSYLAQETLFYAGIRPERNFLSSEEAEKIAVKLKSVLALSVEKGGATMRDYRRLSGKLGRMQENFRVYGLYGNPCIECSTTLSRAVIQGRGVTFCSKCQI
jgi:formamidopyrimidine-DNA glycosylase